MDNSTLELKKYLSPFLDEEKTAVIINFFEQADEEGKRFILEDLKQLYNEEMADQKRLGELKVKFNQLLNSIGKNASTEDRKEIYQIYREKIQRVQEKEKNNLAKIKALKEKLRRFFK